MKLLESVESKGELQDKLLENDAEDITDRDERDGVPNIEDELPEFEKVKTDMAKKY